jgi:parallel beta-helix repeat protein
LYGDFVKTKILHSNDNWLFEVRGSFIGISRFQVDAGAAVSSGNGTILIRSDLGGYERLWFREIETDQSFLFLQDAKNGVNLLVDIQLENVICRRHRGRGIDLEDAFAYSRFYNVTVDFVNSVSKNHIAYRMVRNSGSVWINVDVTGGQVDATTTSQHGFFFDNCIAVWMNNCMADSVGGYGFYFFSDCRAFYMSQCVSSLNGYAGFYFSGTGNINNMFVNCTSIGRASVIFTYKVPAQPGWFVLNGNGTQITGCKANENTGAGFYFQNSVGSVMSGCSAASNTTWGIETLGTNGGIYAVSGINQPASSGNASLATSLDQLVNCQLTSGVIGSLTGPGTI